MVVSINHNIFANKLLIITHGMINRRCTRKCLHHVEGDPQKTIKIEFWNDCLLVYGLTDNPDDYFVFSRLDEFFHFFELNFEVKLMCSDI